MIFDVLGEYRCFQGLSKDFWEFSRGFTRVQKGFNGFHKSFDWFQLTSGIFRWDQGAFWVTPRCLRRASGGFQKISISLVTLVSLMTSTQRCSWRPFGSHLTYKLVRDIWASLFEHKPYSYYRECAPVTLLMRAFLVTVLNNELLLKSILMCYIIQRISVKHW